MELDVGDEGVGRHGACSWMLAVDDKWSPYGSDRIGRSRRNLKWDWLVLVVRDLRSAVPSVILENRYAEGSLAYRRKHIRKQLGIDIAKCENEFTAALTSITAWVRIIVNQSPDLIFRVEDEQGALRSFVADKLQLTAWDTSAGAITDNSNKVYGDIRPDKPTVTASDWLRLPDQLSRQVDWYCATFGYPKP